MNIGTDIYPGKHREIRQLLPWFVNQSLSGPELAAVESHLGECLVCRRELQQLKKLSLAIKSDETNDSAENAAYARLKQRIESQGVAPQVCVGNDVSEKQSADAIRLRPRNRAGFAPSVWAIAAMLLLAVAIPLNLYQSHDIIGTTAMNHFKTLSNGQSEKLASHQIRVVFAEAVDATSKQKIAGSINGRLTGAPSPQGVYAVSLSEDLGEKEIINVIQQLRKDRRVIFAEPAYALLTGMHQGEKP
jgi:Putative zinc-finger